MTGIPLAVWFTSPSTTTSHATCTPRSPLNGTSWVSISHNTWKYITKWYHFFMKLFNSKLKQFFLNLLFSSSPQHMKKCHRPQTQACFGSPAEKKIHCEQNIRSSVLVHMKSTLRVQYFHGGEIFSSMSTQQCIHVDVCF